MKVGEILSCYRSVFGLLPERFETPFSREDNVNIDRYAYDYINDVALALGVEYVMAKRNIKKDIGDMFVINVGAPHLPIIGCMLRAKGVDCYFYLAKMVEHEFIGHFGYFAKKYSSIPINERGALAMMFNAHSPMDRCAALPGAKLLRKLGIKNIYVFVEHNVKPLNHIYDKHPDFRGIKRKYKGINVEIIEADPRPRKSDYMHVIKFAKENKDVVKLMSHFIGRDEKDAWKIIMYGKKVFMD